MALFKQHPVKHQRIYAKILRLSLAALVRAVESYPAFSSCPLSCPAFTTTEASKILGILKAIRRQQTTWQTDRTNTHPPKGHVRFRVSCVWERPRRYWRWLISVNFRQKKGAQQPQDRTVSGGEKKVTTGSEATTDHGKFQHGQPGSSAHKFAILISSLMLSKVIRSLRSKSFSQTAAPTVGAVNEPLAAHVRLRK